MALFENVHNYFERMVEDHIRQTLGAHTAPHDERRLEDIACIALNRLPVKYVREDVDTGFYLTLQDRAAMELAVNQAVSEAKAVVDQAPDGPEERIAAES